MRNRKEVNFLLDRFYAVKDDINLIDKSLEKQYHHTMRIMARLERLEEALSDYISADTTGCSGYCSKAHMESERNFENNDNEDDGN